MTIENTLTLTGVWGRCVCSKRESKERRLESSGNCSTTQRAERPSTKTKVC
ncbi:hypothetical protein [Candidatus Sororendozoicomonas aggregata]|uniref:hypothetical protein n=1 Tax=Candidatus Sororendozoicomonas aggregata TaxID=3073239 RepID=UPI002ED3C344